jgi:hypothetical protein
MTWFNGTSDTLNFSNPKIVDGNGTLPTAVPGAMGPNGTSSVSADQKGNLRAGPEGQYDWKNATDANKSVAVTYHHPAGSGATSVTVSCSSAYLVSDDDATWVQSRTYESASLQQHDATIDLHLRSAAAPPSPPPPPPPPPPEGSVIPLSSDMKNKAAFVNSLFDPAVRGSTLLDPAVAKGALAYSYADATSQGYILDAWLAAWRMRAGDPYDADAYARCPEQDSQFIEFLVNYVLDNGLYLCAPSLTLQTPVVSPPIYASTGYSSAPFIDPTTKAWNYGTFWVDPAAPNQTVSQFLYLLFFGAHTVVVSSSADQNGGPKVGSFREAMKASGLFTRHDLYNSHYGISGGVSGTYYAPVGAPTPTVANRDVEVFAATSPPGQEPLIFAFVTGDTALKDPNSFIQLEGWPSQDVVLPKPGGARHSADYQANISLFWNFSTFGASAYSEKRSTPIFLANANFNLTPLTATRMPSYTGASSLEGWMHPELIDIP